jgi:hypothetical protein
MNERGELRTNKEKVEFLAVWAGMLLGCCAFWALVIWAVIRVVR